MMKVSLVLLGMLILATPTPARAENLCETQFDQEIVPISKMMEEAKDPKRWKLFEDFLSKFRSCLDGSYAQTTQSLIEGALAKDWKGFSAYVSSGNRDANTVAQIESGFSVETGDPKNLAAIQKSAKTACPKQARKFCAKIKKAKLR